MSNYTKKLTHSLLARLNMESKLTGNASDKCAGVAMILSYVIASTGLALFLGFIGYGVMAWLMK